MEPPKRSLCGLRVSPLGIGGAAFATGLYSANTEPHFTPALHEALALGFNYIDTAYWYGQGQSEAFLGRALSHVPRHSFVISTKVCRYEQHPLLMFDFSARRTLQQFDESLARLQLDYVDIIFAHDVEFAPSIDYLLEETIPALQQIKQSGRAKNIGVTSYEVETLREIVRRSEVKIDVILSYCRGNLQDQALMSHLDFFKSHNVDVVNASPLSMGMLTPEGPPSWHLAPDDIQTAARRASPLAADSGLDLTRLAIKFAMDDPRISCTLTSMTSVEQVRANFRAAQPLTEKEQEVTQEILAMFQSCENRNWLGAEREMWSKKGCKFEK